MMIRNYVLTGVLCFAGAAFAGDYPYRAAEMKDVTVTGGFWLPRFETNRLVTVWTDFRKCEETRIPNFHNAAEQKWGSFKGWPFDDSDVYKVVEGAAYTLATRPDPKLEAYLDDLVGWIARSQEPDGYLYTGRTLGFANAFKMMGFTRWSNLEHSHELYNLGHLCEGAVAYYEATGKRALLDVAIKSADLLCRTFGPQPTQLPFTSGHEEIELGLVKLYRATGDARYLRLSKHFMDQRGKYKTASSLVFAQSGALVKGNEMRLPGGYNQNHLAVTNQREAVGHAVRATYLYCGMADAAALLDDADYRKAVDALWSNVAGKKLYLNGSVGAFKRGERFGEDYELPNNGYMETCAGIGNALWNERLFLTYGDAKYVDVLERAIYNGVLSGVSIGGDEFFYPNPLESKGGYGRSKWFGCSCCPVNVVRFIPQVASFAYATRGEAAYVNLFVESEAKLRLSDGAVRIVQKTAYPWEGSSRLVVTPAKEGQKFALHVRIPGWAVGRPVPSDLYEQVVPGSLKDVALKVNGAAVAVKPVKGYAIVDREWKAGDTVEVAFNMPVRRIRANKAVKADLGRLAVERGPIVYCAEGVDNGGHVFRAALPASAELTPEPITIAGTEMVGLTGGGLRLVPYFAWCHRGNGEMQTWFMQERPVADSRTRDSQVTASHVFGLDATEALFDGCLPRNSADESIVRFTFWPRRGTEEWVAFKMPAAQEVKGVEVYWFDDHSVGHGKCALPAAWKVQSRASASAPWEDVKTADATTVRDAFSAATFEKPVTASEFRLVVQLQRGLSAGILEVRIK